MHALRRGWMGKKVYSGYGYAIHFLMARRSSLATAALTATMISSEGV